MQGLQIICWLSPSNITRNNLPETNSKNACIPGCLEDHALKIILGPQRWFFVTAPRRGRIAFFARPLVKTSRKPRAIYECGYVRDAPPRMPAILNIFGCFRISNSNVTCFWVLKHPKVDGIGLSWKLNWGNTAVENSIAWLIQCLVGWTLGCLVCVLVGGVEPQQQPQPTAPTKHTLWDNAFCPFLSCSTSWPVNFENGFTK